MPSRPTFGEAARFWLKLGFISFGGPTGQIAILHTELVVKRKWISEARFLHALNFCMLLPGPEATQLATYIGWLLHKTRGGLVAGTLFVLPAAVLLWALSYVYVTFGEVAWIAAIFTGLKPAVLGIVAAAGLRLGRRALKHPAAWTLAALSFIAIYFLQTPFPLLIASAGIIGWMGGKFWPAAFPCSAGPGADSAVLDDASDSPPHTKPSLGRALRVLGVSLTLWWTPVALLGGWLGWSHTLVREGIFFSKAAMVTFGGAYAVLPYVSQQAVATHGWLTAPQMLDGLALAETTPGPLIMVLQFVGFLGAWQHPGGLPPLLAATLGAFVTTWTTFVPCFLWIFLGAPHMEQLRGHARLTTALSAVTASVVGVIVHLAAWFGFHVLWTDGSGVDLFALVVSAVVFVGLWRWQWNILAVVAGAGAAGLLHHMILA